MIFLLFLLMSCFNTGFNYPKTFEEVSQAAVTVQVSDDDETYYFLGSGAWVKDREMQKNFDTRNLVVTARHVAENLDDWEFMKVCPLISGENCTWVEYAATTSGAYDTSADVAVLVTSGRIPGIDPLRVARDFVPTLGEQVAALGSTSVEYHAVEAYVSTITNDLLGDPYYQITGYGQNGMSGAPVVDRHGDLVGVYVSLPVVVDPVLEVPVLDRHHVAISPAWMYLRDFKPDR